MAVDEQEIRSGTVEELAETVSDAEKREAVHNVRSAGDALFTWDYERSRDALSKGLASRVTVMGFRVLIVME